MAELAVEHLSLHFGGLAVLDDVSLHVEAGELLALIGPNGAGKTSVLNCISGIYRGSGAIRFRGDDIAGRAPHEIAQLGLARTFQHGELFPQMSVLDNLLTGRHARIRTNPVAEMLFLPGVRRASGNILAAESDGAAAAIDAADAVERAGLAGAVGADQSEQFARGNRKRHVVEHGQAAETQA